VKLPRRQFLHLADARPSDAAGAALANRDTAGSAAAAAVATGLELIAYAEANPNKLNMAAPGSGTGPHMASELFRYMCPIAASGTAWKLAGKGHHEGFTLTPDS
jgi:hypothetical protein